MLMGAFLFMYHSITYWYPTLITQMHRPTLPYLAMLNVGGITGAVAFGRISEGTLGRRGAATIATVIGILSVPLYVFTQSTPLLLAGALLMGFFGAGNFGVVPGYLTERFPDRGARGRRRIRLSRRRRARLVHADARRAAAGSRPAAADGDGRLHRRFRHAGDRPDVARSRDRGPPFHGRKLSRWLEGGESVAAEG
jgi:hypothetical protein